MLKPLMAVLLGVLCSASWGAETKTDRLNPQPMDDDVIVSMPCDLKMVFRKVYTSDAPERMQDTRFSAGSQDTENLVSQSSRFAYIQGGFHDKDGYYFLIAKYEMSELQYKALTEDKCPEVSSKLYMPVTSVSWFDGIEAGRRYSLYLAGAKDAPRQGESVAYARMPTDSEFEFAVRGGRAAGTSQFNANTFVTEGSLRDYAWHSGSQSSNGKVNYPGRLKPNPLGLFDLLGNVQEMTSDPFYATRQGRLHGQSGGFVCRGGSYLTSAAAMTSAYRVEKPYYTDGKETRSKDTGLRLVLTVPVMTQMSDVKLLNEEVQKLGADNSSDAASLAALDEIIAQNREIAKQNREMAQTAAEDEEKRAKLAQDNQKLAEDNEKLTAALQTLRQEMVQAGAERDEMQKLAIINNLRNGGILCASIANSAFLRADVEGRYKSMLNLSEDKKEKFGFEAVKARYEDNLAAEKLIAGYFADQIADTVGLYKTEAVQAQLGNAKQMAKQTHLDEYIDLYFNELKNYQGGVEISARRDDLRQKCFDLGRKITGVN